MNDNTTDDTDRVKCPEWGCSLKLLSYEEIEAHLRWDHNRSDHDAQVMVQTLRNTGSE